MKRKFKIVFFGHDKISIPFLREIRRANQLVCIVIPSNRSDSQIDDLKKYALKHKIIIFQPKNPNDLDFIESIKDLKADLAIVYNYSHIFKKPLIELFPLKMINFHGGLLPQYRGANVINWVLVNGERTTGVTVHYISESIDDGPIIAREPVKILKKDDALTLKTVLAKKSFEMLKKVLKKLNSERITNTFASKYGQGNYYHRRKPEDGRIDFNQESIKIYNLVRALVSPWPGAFAIYNDTKIIFDKIKILKIKSKFKPGCIIDINDRGLKIQTKDSVILVEKYHGASKKIFKVGEYFV
jgi:methionyl-tRNA formyltransferase